MKITQIQVYWSVEMNQVPTYHWAIYKTLCVICTRCIIYTAKLDRFSHWASSGDPLIIFTCVSVWVCLYVCVFAIHDLHTMWMPYLVILWCFQVVADQLKVQTIFLLEGSMELSFLKGREGEKKEFIALSCYDTSFSFNNFMSDCIIYANHTEQLHLKAII